MKICYLENNKMNIKQRNPNFEMLRILSMLFIIANHCILHVATPEYQAQQVKGFNFILTDILYQAAYVAVKEPSSGRA